ncbi:fluoride efflux transporter CrcB [Streptomyces bathyalis]|uniref:Fluoride-specific ion channel FluC n=1 Tax=Streptomyces bathyalis TaxID=2710756 RepID=A0A7T1T7S2_9ACTN|nr:fluoride efflux transporter CrcB [Streptomyces bathyalis]QPP07965.1 fluoride efflux transporter CrcB [Streptomyces bathyalis]
MTWVLVAVGGMVGAPLRYLTDRAVQARRESVFPWGTFTVNAVGCLMLGLLTGAVASGAAGSRIMAFLGTGLCGALTTYSTFSYETLRLAERGRGGLASANALLSVLVGLGAVFAGLALARAVLA